MFLAFFRAFFSRLFTLLYTVSSVFGTIGASTTEGLPTTPTDFESAIRFVVFSDNHTEVGENYADGHRVIDMINTCFDMYGDDGIDLFVNCGDFTEYGKDPQAEQYIKAFYDTIGDRAETMVILGNHDLKQTYEAQEHFRETFGIETGEQSITIKGFHFIGVPSYTKSAIQIIPETTVNWAASELKKAEADSNNLPVFTFQHPHNTGTVYGSTIWGCSSLNRVWESHSRVVNFSGHSHFPISDPRSIWQGSYTAVGTGAMARYELEKDLIWGQHPANYTDAAEFWIVEADKDGSVRMSAYDLNTDTFFRTYYIDNVNDSSSFAYTYKNMEKNDTKPEFSSDAKVTYAVNDNGEYEITFDKATTNFVVQNYKIMVYNKLGLLVHSKTYLSDYYLQGMPDTMTINLGDLNIDNGDKFTVKIIAASAYGKLSEPLSVTFNG